ncbi:hypothetical protein Bbelb_002430 [Branchiostoma belcheri]|nr:hypothetical protein Bbelb_002430 [Branchiostoma belcheri]
MPPHANVLLLDVELKATLAFINYEGGPFAMSDQMLKANKSMLDNIKNITSSGLQGGVPPISSDTFEEDVIDDLDDHQRKMGEKAQELEGQWLNEIHTCVTMMESNSAAVKHKLVAFPSSVGSVRSNFDTIFENLETLRSNANKYETGSAYWSERVRAVTAERVCPRCGRSHSHGLSGAHAQCKIQ